MSLFLILMLPLTAVTQVSTITVRVGDDVTLPCENMKDLHDKCHSTTWLYGDSKTSTLFEYGKIHKDAGSKSDRLSVTTNCLLVIKKVTDEDVGRYTCRQFISGQQPTDSLVHLFVINREETTTRTTKAVATSPKNPRPPMTTKTTTTHKTTTDQPSTSVTDDSDSETTTGEETTTPPTTSNPSLTISISLIVAVALAALIITVVAVVRWKRTKGNRTQTAENMADPADGVYYSSIKHIKNTNSKARGESNEDDAVTYATVRAPPTSDGASTDPPCLYSTITFKNM